MPDPARIGSAGGKSRGQLFLIDVPTFARVCDLGDVDAAAAYLVLAAGTGADNRTSTWSREAVNKRTGLNWRKADAAISKLEKANLLRWLEGKGTRKPRIYLPQVETRKPMQKHVAALFDCIANGGQPTTQPEKAAATIGAEQGWLAKDEGGSWRTITERPMVKAYLPKSLVGDEAGNPLAASSVVERVRLSRDHMALRLLIDLYALQNLAEQGGVGRFWLERLYTRAETKTGTGSMRVWTFKGGSLSARVRIGSLSHHWKMPQTVEEKASERAGEYNGAGDFFERVQILGDAGALEWAYYLAEDAAEGATTLYPVGVERYGKMVWTELESIIGGYAIRAACALGGYPGQAREWEERAPERFLLPADRMARKVALVGIPRLRHRAKTSNTSRWRQELQLTAHGHKDVFRGIIAEKAPELLAEADRRLADFNYGSTPASTMLQRDINDTSWSGNEGHSLTRVGPDDPGYEADGPFQNVSERW